MKTTFLNAFLLGALLCTSCYKQEKYDPLDLDPSEVITLLHADPTTLPANNVATSTITAFLPQDAVQGLDVQFQTDMGVFVESGSATATAKTKAVVIDQEVCIVARVRLRNGLSAGVIHVKAALGGYEVEREIASVGNPPNGIHLVVPSFVMGNLPASEMEMTVQLSAASGTVTPGQQVTLAVRDSANAPRGSFRIAEDESNAEGKCRFVFSIMPDSGFTGPLNVLATTGIPGGILQDSTTIHIIE